MAGSTSNEKKLYGETWNEVYGGYFADPEVAAPLIDSILLAADECAPAVIADLGGGTGFVLSQVAGRMGGPRPVRLVCVDVAREQLDDCPEPLGVLQCSVEDLRREMLVERGEGLLLCMRSVMHYFGRDALEADVAGMRSALEPGEYLVHQTICFDEEVDQESANLVYELMDTGKWYPTDAQLATVMEAGGFKVVLKRKAPSLPITDSELMLRYDVDAASMERIGRELAAQCGDRRRVYIPRDDGFTVRLDYIVMTCLAQ